MSASGLTVSIESGDGWPVAGAIFTLTDMVGQQAGLAVTDEQGRAVIADAAAGQYTAIFSAPGFSPAATSIVVAGGRLTELGVMRLERIPTDTNLPAPGVWTIDPVHTLISVTARHAGISSVRGRFNSFGGTVVIGSPVEASTVTAVIQADSIDTASKMRDDHLRSPDFLNVAEFPTVTYRGAGLTATGPDRWTLRGDLSLCGESRPVDLALHYLGSDVDPFGVTRIGFKASGQLRRQDFRIRYAQRLATGIAMVGSTLRIDLDIEAVEGDTLPE